MSGADRTWDADPDALRAADPEIADAVLAETRRQEEGLELIASENFVSPAVLAAMGTHGTDMLLDQLDRLGFIRSGQVLLSFGVFGLSHKWVSRLADLTRS